MLVKRRVLGQSILEMLAFMSVIAVLLGGVFLHIDKALAGKVEAIQASRNALWEPTPKPVVSTTDNYTFARQVGRITQPLQQVTALNLPLNNLKVVGASESHVAMAMLTDPWGVKTTTGLVDEPAKLTLAHYLTRVGINHLLDIIGFFPMTAEFHSKSLRFGWVNSDATPHETLCERQSCQP